MKSFVINLDSRPDRLKKFRDNNTKYIPFTVERFEGIQASCGEDGCTYSHLAILKQQYDLNEFPFLVFEDDCVLLQSWMVVFEAIRQLPDDWDALWLGANLRRPLERYSKNLFRLTNGYATHAIIYKSKRIVEYILNNHNTPSGKNLDIFYRKEVLKRFNCFITFPIVATQLSDWSDIAKVQTNNFDEIVHNYNLNVQ